MPIGDALTLTSIPTPESVLGGGYNCPGCGVPFLTQRDPQRPNDRAIYTGIDVDFDGALILCEPCIAFLASLIGYIDPESGKARTSDVRRAQRRDQAVKAASDARDTAVQAATALLDSLTTLDEVLQ